ncbi:hypothetical protein GCM10009720_16560 [Yaniella flava]|uniref:Single-stranded DNA-binding protein n=1 Tax=Yaniella flava TaxID=287930 RepID=A0ABN2UFN4_9MICC
MASTFTVKGNVAGDLLLYGEENIEDNIEDVRAVGTVFEDRFNTETNKYDISDPYPFTIFGRQAVNLADSISAIKDETGKFPRVNLECRARPFSQPGENQRGEEVDKTHIGLNVVEASISLMWHTAMIEDDGHANSGRSSRSSRGRSGRNSGGRRRGRNEEPEDADEEMDDQVEDDADDVQDEEEEKPRRSSRSSRSSGSRSSGSRTSRSSGSRNSRSGSSRSSRSRSGGSRSSRSSGASRRSRSSYDD